MSDLKYEFLSYEAFPEDQYVKEIVTVMIQDAIILPYQKVSMKDGGSFWTFPGSQAMKGGVKKRINAEFESKRAKLAFESALESFIASRSSPTYQPPQQNASTSPQSTYSGYSESGGVPADGRWFWSITESADFGNKSVSSFWNHGNSDKLCEKATKAKG